MNNINEETAREWLKLSEDHDAIFDGRNLIWVKRQTGLEEKITDLELQLARANERVNQLEQQLWGSK